MDKEEFKRLVLKWACRMRDRYHHKEDLIIGILNDTEEEIKKGEQKGGK